MIAPSSSSPDEQLALVPDRVECLGQLSQPIETQTGIKYMIVYDFFVVTSLPNSLKGAPN